MKKIQLFDSLKSLNKIEFREFGKFVRSPYFNNRSEVIRFYDAIKKYYPDFKTEKIDESKVFEEIYPGKKFSSVLMRKIYSLFVNLLMDYIVTTGFRKNTLEYNVKLLYFLYERKLPAELVKKSKLITNLLKNSFHTIEYYEYKFKHTSKLNGHLSDYVSIPDYQKELDDFIEQFLVIALVLYHRLLTTSNLHKIKYDLKLYKEVLLFIENNNFENVTIVAIYYNLVKLLETQDEKYFLKLIKLREKFKKKLTPILQYNIFVTLVDYSLNRIYKGDIGFRKHLYLLTKNYFEKFTFPEENSYLNPILYTGAIRNAAYLKEFGWINNFKNKYTKAIDPEILEETLNYSNAFIEFEKGNYKESLNYVCKVNPVKIAAKTNSKNLFIMLFYELGYYDELVSQIDSYKHFLRNNDVGETIRNRCLPFLKYLSDLLKIKQSGNKNNLTLFLKKLNNSEYFNLKEWILNKAEELIK
ncbi:MAG: hypothetical protein J0M37_01940 [Ignavibacteria bacterium]|nr:hypothetical protein [Ignavibacteria bacterium]